MSLILPNANVCLHQSVRNIRHVPKSQNLERIGMFLIFGRLGPRTPSLSTIVVRRSMMRNMRLYLRDPKSHRRSDHNLLHAGRAFLSVTYMINLAAQRFNQLVDDTFPMTAEKIFASQCKFTPPKPPMRHSSSRIPRFAPERREIYH
jgi:hypothetical protein